MNIITPKQLWQDYNRHTDPQTTELSRTDRERRQYFSALKLSGGEVVRVYSRLCLPQGIERPPVIIMLTEAERDIDTIDPEFFTTQGFAVLMVDYFGKTDQKSRFTLYPKALDAAWQCDPDLIYLPPDNPCESAWYYFSTCVFHAVTFLESCDDVINTAKIGIFGVGEGSSLVFKASVCPEIKAGISFFCGDILGKTDSPRCESKTEHAKTDNKDTHDPMLAYKISLDSRAYADGCFPILINATTNEQGGAFDYLSGLYSAAENTRFCVFANADKAVSTQQRANIKPWFDNIFEGKPLSDPPEVSVFGSSGALYAEIKTKGEVKLYYAEEAPSACRSWKKLIPHKAGENKFLCKLEVSDPAKTVYVFASVTFSEDCMLSTQVVAVRPARFLVVGEQSFSRLIYQFDGNMVGFLYPDGDFCDTNLLGIKEGPMGLEGICGDMLVTFRPADMRHRGKEGSLLQLMLSCDKTQEVELSVMDEGGAEFRCTRKLPAREWTTFTLSGEDFKGVRGVARFDRVMGIKLRGKDIILNSILWV